MILARLVQGTHEDIVELGANKELEMIRQTAGLVCSSRRHGSFSLSSLVHGATRLASALWSKHNQGRRRSSAWFTSEPITGPYCMSHAADEQEMCTSRRTLQCPVANRQGRELRTAGNLQDSLCNKELEPERLDRYSEWRLPPRRSTSSSLLLRHFDVVLFAILLLRSAS